MSLKSTSVERLRSMAGKVEGQMDRLFLPKNRLNKLSTKFITLTDLIEKKEAERVPWYSTPSMRLEYSKTVKRYRNASSGG